MSLAARGGLALVAALALGAGCSSSAPKNVDRFVGAWTFDSGALSATCTGLPPFSTGLQGDTLVLAKGTSSDLVSTLTTSMGTCTLTLTVMGTVATADPGQSCTFTVMVLGNNVPVAVGIQNWTVTTADGVTMTTAASAVGDGGLANGCPVNVSGTATKHAGDASAG